jgi:hypothetical protein
MPPGEIDLWNRPPTRPEYPPDWTPRANRPGAVFDDEIGALPTAAERVTDDNEAVQVMGPAGVLRRF